MKNTKWVLCFFFLMVILPLKAYGAETDEYMILFRHHIDGEILKKYNIHAQEKYEVIPTVLAELNKKQIDQLRSEPEVAKVQPDKSYKVQSQIETWGYKKIYENDQYRSPFTGKGVKIAVIDTGIAVNHPDIKVKGGMCVINSDCHQGYDDDNGHGTHVAGIIGALDNGIGVVGVAPDADLYAVKAFDYFGQGTTSSITAGVDWAIQHHVDIINLSVTTSTDDQVLKNALDKAYKAGILITAAAGNDGDSAGSKNSILYPAKYSSVIAVGSVNSRLVRLPFSATGPELEVVAPGENVLSTYPSSLDIVDGKKDGYTSMTGTSMATPFVTGVLADLKEQYKNKSAAEIRQMLQQNAKDLGPAGKDPLYGYGLVQIKPFQSTLLPNMIVKAVKADNGLVEFQIDKPASIQKVYVKRRSGMEGDITNEIRNGLWDDYVPAGTYYYFFTFTDGQGQQYQTQVKVAMSEPQLADVTPYDWFSEKMLYLYHRSILKGDRSGHNLQPAKSITRGEAVALVGRAIGLNGSQRNTVFPDVPKNYFASGYIQSAFERGIIKGFHDGAFHPSQPVTRAEMAILISRAYDLTYSGTNHFQDVAKNMTGYKEINALADAGISNGYSNGTFEPYKPISRAEFCVFLAKAENPFFR
jgi:subtilisin